MIHLRPLGKGELRTVSKLEQLASAHPWSLKNIQSSYQAGHTCLAIMDDTTLVGNIVLLAISAKKLKQAELLNIVVFKPFQAKGFATKALSKLIDDLREQHFETLLLEVRQSNCYALQLYRAAGFDQVGERKDYYSSEGSGPETAILMQLGLKTN